MAFRLKKKTGCNQRVLIKNVKVNLKKCIKQSSEKISYSATYTTSFIKFFSFVNIL